MATDKEQKFPPQRQGQPGREGEVEPQPASKARQYRAADKLAGKIALITADPFDVPRRSRREFWSAGSQRW